MTMRTVTHTTFAGIQSRHMTASKVMSGFYQHDMRREYCDWIAWNIYCDGAHNHAAPILQLPTDWFSEVSFHYLAFWLFGSLALTVSPLSSISLGRATKVCQKSRVPIASLLAEEGSISMKTKGPRHHGTITPLRLFKPLDPEGKATRTF